MLKLPKSVPRAVLICSIFTKPAMNRVPHELLEPISQMTFRTDRRAQDTAVLETRIGVYLVAAQTTDRFIAIDHHSLHVSPDVAVAGIQFRVASS